MKMHNKYANFRPKLQSSSGEKGNEGRERMVERERGKDRKGEEKRERKKKVRKEGEGLNRELFRVPAGKR